MKNGDLQMTDKMYEEFVKFANHWRYDLTKDEDDFYYMSSMTQRVWDSWCRSWQVSKESVVVELPAQWATPYEEKEVMTAIYVLESLEKAGVSYK